MNNICIADKLPYITDSVEDNIDWIAASLMAQHEVVGDLGNYYTERNGKSVKILAIEIDDTLFCSEEYFLRLLNEVEFNSMFADAKCFKGIAIN